MKEYLTKNKSQVKKILVIDDEHEIVNQVIEILEEENPNYTFYFAKDGIKGIEAAKRHLPDIIIVDWAMPGLSGIATIKHLKKNESTNKIPVVMLTGKMTSSENLAEAFSAGAIDFIRKPIDPIELSARISSMLLLASFYRQIISKKNQELASVTMDLVQNNEERYRILQEIESLDKVFGTKNEALSEKLQKLCSEISNNINSKAWTQFEIYFKKTHPSFMTNLLSKHNDLQPSEIKIAMLVRLNLSIKEIASIAFMSEDSVKTTRSRIRRKMALDRNQNLTTYLQQF